ncbi:MAG: ATP-binding protein [Candidatus Eisenbacteria bacterium]
MLSGSLWKYVLLAAVITLTVAIHYGVLGHSHADPSIMQAVHARLCYIPIVIAAVWFGLKGGLAAASIISILVIPYILIHARAHGQHVNEFVEIVFYFAIGSLAGALVERERLQRKKREEAQSGLERAQRLASMGQMVAGIAHEIKNPLASIKGAAEILAQDVAPGSPKHDFAEIIRKETRRVDRTVRSFLEFARPRPGKFALEEPAVLLSSSLKQMEPQINAASLTLEAAVPDLTGFVWADPDKLRQVFINLLLNAIAATRPGGRIRVELSRDGDGHKKAWKIAFSDTGEGIAPENLGRVFEPFFSLKATGSGLGLAIVRSIVEEHGGRVEVSSEVGHGATFTVFLPLRESPER